MSEKYQVVTGDTLWALAERFYGDGILHPVIAVINHLSDPDHIQVGQELEIPYVTFRHRVVASDTKKQLALHFYNDIGMVGLIEIANHAAQRDLIVGEWLLIPHIANPGHHTVVAGETLPQLADRWYGEAGLWPIIAIANHLGDQDPSPGEVLIQPRLNRRHKVVGGETLWNLAKDHYGNHQLPILVKLVAAANHIDDPEEITVGQIIFFPSLWP